RFIQIRAAPATELEPPTPPKRLFGSRQASHTRRYGQLSPPVSTCSLGGAGFALPSLRLCLGLTFAPPVGFRLGRDEDASTEVDLARCFALALQVEVFAFADRVVLAESQTCMCGIGRAALVPAEGGALFKLAAAGGHGWPPK